MFPAAYWPVEFFAPEFWAKSSGEGIEVVEGSAAVIELAPHRLGESGQPLDGDDA